MKLSLSEACNLTERSFQQKTKKTSSKKQEKNSVQTGKGNFELKKKSVAVHESAAESEESCRSFMNLASFQCFLDFSKVQKEKPMFLQFLLTLKKKITLTSSHSWPELLESRSLDFPFHSTFLTKLRLRSLVFDFPKWPNRNSRHTEI